MFQVLVPIKSDDNCLVFEQNLFIEYGVSPTKAQVLEAINRMQERYEFVGLDSRNWDECRKSVMVCDDSDFPIISGFLRYMTTDIVHPKFGKTTLTVKKIDSVKL